jgi:hypothetical protein
MNSLRKKLPIGIQSFAKLRAGGFYYVDKTAMAYALTQESGYYFLSRPRRFGKSLFLDTLKELFEGNEALFAGLSIHPLWNWQQSHPVLRFSFGGGVLKTPEDLAQTIHRQLEDYERKFSLPARYPDKNNRFADLIAGIKAQSGRDVVLLIDEYDKPILDNITDHTAALAMRESLKDFYSVIKDMDGSIRFVFLTGEALISTFDVDCITPEALLFQAGYLTIVHCEQGASGKWRYTLGYPNHEVAMSLNASLLSVYTFSAASSDENCLRLEDLLLTNDLPGLRALFQAFFAGIPYHWYVNNPIANYEGYYASVFYSYFAALGFEVRVEDATNQGRIDMAVKLPERIFLFEFKVVELLPDGRALQQLKDKAYADKYRDEGLPIMLVGVEFSRESRNVVGFESERA